MKYYLEITSAQASALARLINLQIEAYQEASGSPVRRKSPRKRPFTGADLDSIEPLVGLLQKLSRR
jgi:hypothetical protein